MTERATPGSLLDKAEELDKLRQQRKKEPKKNVKEDSDDLDLGKIW